MNKIEGRCEHGAQVRVTDRRDPQRAQASVFTCARPCCMHEAFHFVAHHTGVEHPLIVPLPPI